MLIHNLYAIKTRSRQSKTSNHEGRLWEYVFKKARAHPKLFEMVEVMTENSEFFQLEHQNSRKRQFFYLTKRINIRPEVQSFHEIVENSNQRKKNPCY